MKAKTGVLLVVLAVLLSGCNSATPAPALSPADEAMLDSLVATVSALETEKAEATAVEPVVVVVTPEPPAPLVAPTATPEYRVVACGERPKNGTLIQILVPTTSRACSDTRCENQGKVVAGSVRPLEAWDWDEASDRNWLRFTYLPLEGINYTLMEYVKEDGEWQWRLLHQWVLGNEGEEFQCVEPWS